MADRDSKGRFVKGNKAAVNNNGGRPRRTVEEETLAVLNSIVTTEELEKLFLSGLSRAKSGDLGWAKLLLAYKIGLPVQRQEVTGPEGGPIVLTWPDANTTAEAP